MIPIHKFQFFDPNNLANVYIYVIPSFDAISFVEPNFAG